MTRDSPTCTIPWVLIFAARVYVVIWVKCSCLNANIAGYADKYLGDTNPLFVFVSLSGYGCLGDKCAAV